MKKLFGLFLSLFLISSSMFASDMDFDKEQVIIKGLSKKQLKERLKYVEMAKLSHSEAVFEKLRQMYKVNNAIKDDVFYAMKCMNFCNKGIFSEAFAASMKEEFERLKKLNWSNKPQIFYLQVCLSIMQDQLYPGFDSFVEEISINIDKVLENSSHERIDPVKLRTEILGECVFYFAKRGRSGYMEKLAEVFKKDEISEQISIIEIFTEKRDPAIFDHLTQILRKQEVEDYCPDLFIAYQDYASALNKQIPAVIQEKINQDENKARQEIEEFFQGYRQ